MPNVGEFPGVDFLVTAFKFQKRKKNSSSLVYTYVLHKTCNLAFSRRSRAVTQRNLRKSVMHVHSCFANQTYRLPGLLGPVYKEKRVTLVLGSP